jgi:hypothetical protein
MKMAISDRVAKAMARRIVELEGALEPFAEVGRFIPPQYCDEGPHLSLCNILEAPGRVADANPKHILMHKSEFGLKFPFLQNRDFRRALSVCIKNGVLTGSLEPAPLSQTPFDGADT